MRSLVLVLALAGFSQAHAAASLKLPPGGQTTLGEDTIVSCNLPGEPTDIYASDGNTNVPTIHIPAGTRDIPIKAGTRLQCDAVSTPQQPAVRYCVIHQGSFFGGGQYVDVPGLSSVPGVGFSQGELLRKAEKYKRQGYCDAIKTVP